MCELMGFHTSIPVSGQTYTRKIDSMIVRHRNPVLRLTVALMVWLCVRVGNWQLNALSGIATSAHKMAVDLRLLASMKEVRGVW